jgi:hypothetical protein
MAFILYGKKLPGVYLLSNISKLWRKGNLPCTKFSAFRLGESSGLATNKVELIIFLHDLCLG